MRPFRPCLETLEDRCVPATFTVTNLNEGTGVPGLTLREAIGLANGNNNAVADTIVFKSTLKGTLSLTGGELPIEESLKIKGLGANRITIDAGGNSRIFNIDDSGAGTLINVSISKLALTGGAAAFGGAIFSSEKLALAQCQLFGNQASSHGGAVAALTATVTVTACTFHSNLAVSGGALFCTESTVSINGSRFLNNRANQGAGLLFSESDVELARSTISGNSALAGNVDGGAIRQAEGTLTIHACTLSGNAARNGGALYIDGVKTLITSTTIANNTANGQGGGILLTGPGSDLLVRNSTISGNRAIEEGGGLAILNGDNVTIQNSTIAFNDSVSEGGGIYTETDVDLVSTIVAKNLALIGPGNDLRSAVPVDDPFRLSFSLIGADPGLAAGILQLTGNLPLGTDPRLGPLASNGGPTQTHALLASSPALNVSTDSAANPGGLTTDQRGAGFKRVKGGAIDIGAFELK